MLLNRWRIRGGLTVGGYFTVRSLIPPSLENKVKELGLDILASNWGAKEEEYKKATGDDLINGIGKPTGSGNIDGFEGKLSTWCNKWKVKSFEGDDNFNYRRFSLWCTVTRKIQEVLSKRGGWTALNEDEIKQKLESYNKDTNTDKFAQEPAKAKTPLADKDLVALCTTKKEGKYKYESDDEFKKVVKWCYKKA